MSSSRFRAWPITETTALLPMLHEMGLKLPASEIDGTSGSADALSDAMVSVGPAGRGGTGSFISSDGLIITNHHVALDAVRQASSVEHDYSQHGFVSHSRDEELAGPDYEVRITRSCQDVSERVLAACAAEATDPLVRSNKVRAISREIVADAEAARPGMRCAVSEMSASKSYVLFYYERLRDVRIVYVPPMSLGNFGGDTDNFEWPRHSADFTLLRAYCSPDGSPAEFSPDNVPYKPRRFLRACPAGAQPNDFVFLLGFPGSTMRYAPSARLGFADEVAVPALVQDFGQKLDLINTHSTDRAVALKLLSARKSLANEHKRSAGKRVMMRKLALLPERKAEEEQLIVVEPAAGPILQRLGEIYDLLRAGATQRSALERMRGVYHGSTLLAMGHVLHEAKVEGSKPDEEREEDYCERNRGYLVQRMTKRLCDMHGPHQRALLEYALSSAHAAGFEGLGLVADFCGKDTVLSRLLLDGSAAVTRDSVEAMLVAATTGSSRESEPSQDDDPFVAVAAKLYPVFVRLRDEQKALFSERDVLLGQLLELQKKATCGNLAFYPDANSTLRISAGHVEGYQAADAVQHAPITTLAGLIDKHAEAVLLCGEQEGPGEFSCPERLVRMCTDDKEACATPTNILYSTDTVGGNSGSPVMNANGEFVAINFDRQRPGLMNEYKWSAEYSRSIGVDVRYILWLVGKYDSAQHLVNEMVQ
jgi:hypothetical protein